MTTDSGDATGEVTSETDAASDSRADVERALHAFVGAIQQRPPMTRRCASTDGGSTSSRVRASRSSAPRGRFVVHALELVGCELPSLRLRIRCGKGTYVRTLATDLGEALGVGAHLTALRRTRVGPFALGSAVPLPALAATTHLLSPAEALADHATVPLDDSQVRDVRAGKVRTIAELRAPDGAGSHVRLLDPQGTLVAVAEHDAGRLTLARVFC